MSSSKDLTLEYSTFVQIIIGWIVKFINFIKILNRLEISLCDKNVNNEC